MGSLSKDDEISELKNDITWIKKHIGTKGNPLYKLYESNSPKKDLIMDWGRKLEKLHTLGGYEKPITTISTTIRTDLKALGLKEALNWAGEILPFKYKDTSYQHGNRFLNYSGLEDRIGQRGESSSIEKIDYSAVNISYIEDLEADVIIIKQFIHDLKTNTEFVPKLDQAELEEYYTRKRGIRNKLLSIKDGREKILPHTQHWIFAALTICTQNDIYVKYVLNVRNFANKVKKITAKQMGKVLRGHVTKMDIMYEPKSIEEAKDNGFTGFQCDYCGNWRVENRYTGDANREECQIEELEYIEANSFAFYCYACGKWMNPKSKKLASKSF